MNSDFNLKTIVSSNKLKMNFFKKMNPREYKIKWGTERRETGGKRVGGTELGGKLTYELAIHHLF